MAHPPYLAVTLDSRPKVRLAATALGLHPGVIQWGLEDLWEHAWRTESNVATATALAGCFGTEWGRIVDTLAQPEIGFLEEMGDGRWRIRGAERYLRITEGRRKGGLASAGNLKRGKQHSPGSSPADPPAPLRLPSGLHPGSSPALQRAATIDDLKKTPQAPNEAHKRATQIPEPSTQRATERPSEVHQPTPFEILREEFTAANGTAPLWGMGEEIALRPLSDQPAGEVRRRARRAFAPGRTRHPKTIGTCVEFVRFWNHFATDEAATGPPAKGRATEADKNHENPKTIQTVHGEELDFFGNP